MKPRPGVVLCDECGVNVHDPRAERCQECHYAATSKPCPSMAHYNKGCRCEPCRELARTERAKYRRRAGLRTREQAQRERWARYWRERGAAGSPHEVASERIEVDS